MSAQTDMTVPNSEGKRINFPLQGARGLFCLFVFVYHVYHSGLGTFPQFSSWASDFVFRPLQYGVELFFGLSGFFIVRTIRRSPSVLHFAWDRITRIYPVLWLTILCVLGIQIAFRQQLLPAGWIALSFLTAPPFIPYAHVNPIAWTLDYEVAFYAYCGVCWALRHRTRILWPLLALPAIAAMLFFPRVTMMAVGAALGLGLADKPAALALARYPAFHLLAFLIGWHVLVSIAGDNVQHLSPLGMPVARALLFEAGILAVSALGGLALLGMSKGYGRLSKLLSSRPMLFMGSISYSFYLWHIPLMGGIKRLLVLAKHDQDAYSQAVLLAISFAIALPVAWLSYYFIEVRATGILRKMAAFHPSFRKSSGQSALEQLALRET